jgi:hypothetical protein
MSKLIAAYLANPTDKARDRLIKYVNSHPMATCFATPEETAVLKSLT